MLTEEQVTKLQLLKQIVDFTLAAQAVLSEEEPTVQEIEPVDIIAWRISIRNRVLAGSGVKAAWLGTLSTEPEYGVDDLLSLGALTPTAAQLLTNCRDDLRAAALALEVE